MKNEKGYEKRTAWIADKYTRVAVSWPNDFAETVKAAARAAGESNAAYIRAAIEARMDRDGFTNTTAATRYEVDDQGDRKLTEFTQRGVLFKRDKLGWINTETGETYRKMSDAKASVESKE